MIKNLEYMGMLFGARLLLETEDKWVIEQAIKYLENTGFRPRTDKELEDEINSLNKDDHEHK